MSDAPKLTLALLGFSPSGKSTFTNSMAGKRIVEMGMDRTTMVPHLVDTENSLASPNIEFLKVKKGIWSDDKVPLAILDLAGVADAEDAKKNNRSFNETATAWMLRADVVCWMTPLQNAFMSNHEENEFEAFYNELKANTEETGTLFQVMVLLTKVSADVTNAETTQPTKADKKKAKKKAKADTSIDTDVEDNSNDDNGDGSDDEAPEIPCAQVAPGEFRRVELEKRYQSVCEKLKRFPDVHVAVFNAHGRIRHHKDSNGKDTCSKTLKDYVTSLGVDGEATHYNTELKMRWAVDNLEERRQHTVLTCVLGTHFEKKIAGWDQAKINKDITEKITLRPVQSRLLEYLLIRSQTELEAYHKKFGTNKYGDYTDANWDKLCDGLSGVRAQLKLGDALAGMEATVLSKRHQLVLFRIIKLVGADHLTCARLYLWLTSNNANTNHGGMNFNTPKSLGARDGNIHHQHLQLDVEFKTKPAIVCSKNWINKVVAARKILWPAQNHGDLELSMLFMNCFMLADENSQQSLGCIALHA